MTCQPLWCRTANLQSPTSNFQRWKVRADSRPLLPRKSNTMRKLPTLGSRGKSWSAARRFQGWLASWAQDRRRGRLLPAPLLVATWPSLATWAWTYANPARWNAYNSLYGGLTYQFDDWATGSGRQYAPDGGQHLMFIVGVDANGKEITHRSNAVRPDDAIAPPIVPAAPVITSIEYDQGSIWIDFTCATPGLVTNYQIFRSVDEEVQDFYANQSAPATRFYDLSPSGGNGSLHYYWIIAQGPGGSSDFSNLMTIQYP